jgi:fatty-acyl-CoA synthase
MMDFPLTVAHLLERGRALFGEVEIVSQQHDKSRHRQSYRDLYSRSEKLAKALLRLGLKPGEVVATLSWNHRQHLECYLGVPAMGAVVHTLNLRLHPDEIGYIAHHANDAVLVVDRSLFPLFERFRSKVPGLRHVLVVNDDGGELPAGTLDYETLLSAEEAAPHAGGFRPSANTPFTVSDERQAAMICYTSGTTGNPKGVAYTHRSTVLHALGISQRDAVGLGCEDVVLPVVPMFHASAWGMPYAAVMAGAKLVFPGRHLDPASLLDLMVAERVTLAAGVPTIWIGILQLLDANPGKWDLSAMRTMVIGGSAAPPALIEGFQTRHNLEVTHAWGMTETNPLGTLAKVTPRVRARGTKEAFSARASQGIPVAFVEQRHVDDQGKILPWDGKAMGELEVRGPWVANSYMRDEGPERFSSDGWFKTGDVVTIDEDGYVRITDRSKDVVKSGGEWISSVSLENALMAHPSVLEAAVFAGRHPKWDERPIAAIVKKPGQEVSEDELRALLTDAFPKFWMPDAFVFVEQIPRTSTGKFLKSRLREQFGEMLVKNEESAG